jgi:phage gp45-like
MIAMVRGIIKSIAEGKIKKVSASGRSDETFDEREYFQHYGFTSRPLKDGELILIREGNHIVAIASDDRRYRIAVEDGEVALYTDEGDKIHFKRGKEIEIVCGNKLTATVENDVEITTKRAKISASEKCEIISPDIKLTSDSTVEISGDSKVTINSDTKVEVNCDDVVINGSKVELGGSDGTMRKLIDERLIDLFNAHTHGGLVPTSPLTLDAVATTITKAG